MVPLQLTSTSLAALSSSERNACSRFVERQLGAAAARYLDDRFGRYSVLHCARSSAGLSALMLTDSATQEGLDLHYVGPVFSTRRAYLPLLFCWLDSLARKGAAFCALAEVETSRVGVDLARLLPGWVYPRDGAATVPADVVALARKACNAFAHVHDFDPATFTTRIVEPLPVGPNGNRDGRYRLLVLPCCGTTHQPEVLRKDLARGLESITARRADPDLLCSGQGG